MWLRVCVCVCASVSACFVCAPHLDSLLLESHLLKCLDIAQEQDLRWRGNNTHVTDKLGDRTFLRMFVCVLMCVFACVSACVFMCVRVRACAYVCESARVFVLMCMCACLVKVIREEEVFLKVIVS